MALEDSSFGRLIGVLVSPGKTFRSLAQRPTWLVPLLVLAVLGMDVGLLVNQRLDQREMIRTQMEKFGQNLSEQQIDEAVERASNPSPVLRAVSVVTGLLGQTLVYLFIAFLFWVILKLAGSDMTFKGSLSTYVHAAIPAAVSFLLAIPVLYSRAVIHPSEMMGGYLASSPAAFVPAETGPLIKAALGAFDFFTLWALVLTIIGYRTVAKVSTGAAAATAILLWLVGVGLRIGFAALFG